MERPAILNRSMPRTPDAVIGFPAPRTTNVSVPKTKIYEANLHSFKGLQKKYSRCRAECEGQMNTIFEDTVDFRSCGPQLFNHKVKLPRGGGRGAAQCHGQRHPSRKRCDTHRGRLWDPSLGLPLPGSQSSPALARQHASNTEKGHVCRQTLTSVLMSPLVVFPQCLSGGGVARSSMHSGSAGSLSDLRSRCASSFSS